MSYVTCLAIGDPHFQTDYLVDCETFIEKILQLVDTLNPDFVIILGDLLHWHETCYQPEMKMANKLLKKLYRRVLTYLIIGNHDMCNQQQFLTDNHMFIAHKEWSNNLIICDKPKQLELDEFKFVFCPYVPNGRFIEALDTVGEHNKADCIFAHQEFFGSLFNPTMKSTEGDKWPIENPFVISGHLHIQQTPQENIYYPGSSMRTSFGDMNNKIVAFVTFKKSELPQIQQISLDIHKRKIVHVNLASVNKIKIDETVKTKLKVKCTSEQFQVFKESNTYKTLTEQGVKILIDELLEKKNITNKKNILDILGDLIANDDEYTKNNYLKLKNIGYN